MRDLLLLLSNNSKNTTTMLSLERGHKGQLWYLQNPEVFRRCEREARGRSSKFELLSNAAGI